MSCCGTGEQKDLMFFQTCAQDVFDVFETSFREYEEIPKEVELIWLKQAVARYNTEVDDLVYDEFLDSFGCELDPYVIGLLARYMKERYQQREVSKINKRVSIVGKDLSIDGNGNSKAAARYELENDQMVSAIETEHLKTPAYN